MRSVRSLGISMLITLAFSLSATAQTIIAADGSPFPVSRGMTIQQAIQALKPEHQTYALGPDSGWLLQVHDNDSYDDVVLTLWSNDSQDYVIRYSAKVNNVMLHNAKYRTREGVHVGMFLKDVEKKLGKLKRIYTSEPTFQEFAEFTKMPNGVSFAVSGGLLSEGQRETQRYSPDARVTRIDISFL